MKNGLWGSLRTGSVMFRRVLNFIFGPWKARLSAGGSMAVSAGPAQSRGRALEIENAIRNYQMQALAFAHVSAASAYSELRSPAIAPHGQNVPSDKGLVIHGLGTKPRRNRPVTRVILQDVLARQTPRPRRSPQKLIVNLAARGQSSRFAGKIAAGHEAPLDEVSAALPDLRAFEDLDTAVRHLRDMARLMRATIGNAPRPLDDDLVLDLDILELPSRLAGAAPIEVNPAASAPWPAAWPAPQAPEPRRQGGMSR